MKNVVLALMLLGVMATSHKVENIHEPKYKTIFDYDPAKQELIEMCCPRKPNPLSPSDSLPHPMTF